MYNELPQDNLIGRRKEYIVDNNNEIETLKEIAVRRQCGNPLCNHVENDVKFKVCGRCKAFKYCSQDCQITHWKGGHKSNCVQKK